MHKIVFIAGSDKKMSNFVHKGRRNLSNPSNKRPADSKNLPHVAGSLSAKRPLIGNQAMQRMLNSAMLPFGTIQAKLKMNPPDDKYEREADRMAEQVMRMPDPLRTGSAHFSRSQGIHIQRRCPACDEEELRRKHIREDILKRKGAPGPSPEVTPEIAAQVTGLHGGGEPLQKSVRNFFEPRFGHDFSRVRIHTDSRASQIAGSIDARAFTIGRDIVFYKGQYSPETPSGKRLLAHELTHFVQQKGTMDSGLSTSTIYRFLRRADRPYQNIVNFSDMDRRPRADGGGTIHYGIRVHIPSRIEDRPLDVDTAIDCIEAALRRDVRRLRAPGLIERNLGIREAIQRSLERQRSQDVVTIEVGYTRQPERGYRASAIQIEGSEPLPVPPPRQEPTPVPIPPEEDERTRRGRRRRSRRPQGAQQEDVERSREMLIRGPICGPDVTNRIRNTLSNVRWSFGRLTALQGSACRNLDFPPEALYSWDIIELHNSDWIWQTFRPECATIGGNPPCGHSIQVGTQCHYAGSVNYVVYGLMCRLCYDRGIRRFTEEHMLAQIEMYKSGAPNYHPSRQWAIAGYRNWPSSGTPAGDRSNCSPTCPTLRGTRLENSPFFVRWCPMLDPDSTCL